MSLRCLGALLLAILILPAVAPAPAAAETPVPAVVVRTPSPKLSKFALVSTRTGTLIRREQFPLQSAKAEGVDASVIRLEDVTAQEVVFAMEVNLTERRGQATVSEEEMADLKDSADYIVLNVAKLNASEGQLRLEYRALSGASFGYSVHRLTANGDELPPAAYIEVPGNPYYPEIGGFQRLTPQTLQKIVAEARKTMDSLKAPKKP